MAALTTPHRLTCTQLKCEELTQLSCSTVEWKMLNMEDWLNWVQQCSGSQTPPYGLVTRVHFGITRTNEANMIMWAVTTYHGSSNYKGHHIAITYPVTIKCMLVSNHTSMVLHSSDSNYIVMLVSNHTCTVIHSRDTPTFIANCSFFWCKGCLIFNNYIQNDLHYYIIYAAHMIRIMLWWYYSD